MKDSKNQWDQWIVSSRWVNELFDVCCYGQGRKYLVVDSLVVGGKIVVTVFNNFSDYFSY